MQLLKHAKDDGNATDASMPVNAGLTLACPSCKKKACEVLLVITGQLPTKATRNDSSDQGEQLCNQSLPSFVLTYIHYYESKAFVEINHAKTHHSINPGHTHARTFYS